jgi:hypothetical protein
MRELFDWFNGALACQEGVTECIGKGHALGRVGLHELLNEAPDFPTVLAMNGEQKEHDILAEFWVRRRREFQSTRRRMMRSRMGNISSSSKGAQFVSLTER